MKWRSVAALVCLIALSTGCSHISNSFSSDTEADPRVSAIRETLGRDCTALPVTASDLPIRYTGESEDSFATATYDVNGMQVSVHDTDFGPSINDSASLALHNAWGCGGITHFMP